MSCAARRLALTAAGLALVAAGCAGPGGGALVAGADACGQQVGGFNGAGQAFLAPTAGAATWGSRQPLTATNFGRGVPAPGTGLEATLAQENADLDSVQIAFDALLYCRWIEARTIRAELAAGRTPRPAAESRMAALRARLQRDLARAQAVLESLEQRDSQRAAAVEAAAPGVRRAAAAARSGAGNTRRVVAAATVPLRLRPEAGAPEIGRVPAGQAVSVRPAQSGFALVEGQGGLRGYAPSGAFQVAERAAPAVAAAGPGGRVRVLAASNIAKRDNFAESLALAREAAVSGFELAT
ncbi:SH3 domain-containing protein [Roseomonas sp. HF4]|uniref:SH3 domain-containing protein n=1 Tax=Roseomonas sp. HF4 TaxID=2562313 RepID=UPI0010BF8199|nr:SH3 domain-containing protein [Roseomonas sp. HF4]